MLMVQLLAFSPLWSVYNIINVFDSSNHSIGSRETDRWMNGMIDGTNHNRYDFLKKCGYK